MLSSLTLPISPILSIHTACELLSNKTLTLHMPPPPPTSPHVIDNLKKTNLPWVIDCSTRRYDENADNLSLIYLLYCCNCSFNIGDLEYAAEQMFCSGPGDCFPVWASRASNDTLGWACHRLYGCVLPPSCCSLCPSVATLKLQCCIYFYQVKHLFVVILKLGALPD